MQICKKFLPLHSQSARDVYYRFTLHYKKENLVAERNLGDFFMDHLQKYVFRDQVKSRLIRGHLDKK